MNDAFKGRTVGVLLVFFVCIFVLAHKTDKLEQRITALEKQIERK